MQIFKVMMGLTLITSIANAQTAATATTATATQTSTATVAEVKPAAAKKVFANLGYEASSGIKDVKEKGSRALIDVFAFAGVQYQLTETVKTELRHNFAAPIIGDSAQLSESMASGQTTPYRTYDPTIHANVKTNWSILGSKALTIGNRYYIPVSAESVRSGSRGTLRTQTMANWDLNPAVTLSAGGQLRLTMNSGTGSTANQALGADSKLRMIPILMATYNFNDALNAYYNPYMDANTTGHQRGNLADGLVGNNTLYQEAGANITAGAVTINPALLTSSDLSGASALSRAGSYEMTSYELRFYANF